MSTSLPPPPLSFVHASLPCAHRSRELDNADSITAVQRKDHDDEVARENSARFETATCSQRRQGRGASSKGRLRKRRNVGRLRNQRCIDWIARCIDGRVKASAAKQNIRNNGYGCSKVRHSYNVNPFARGRCYLNKKANTLFYNLLTINFSK